MTAPRSAPRSIRSQTRSPRSPATAHTIRMPSPPASLSAIQKRPSSCRRARTRCRARRPRPHPRSATAPAHLSSDIRNWSFRILGADVGLPWHRSGRLEDALAQQLEPGTAAHGPLDRLQAADLPSTGPVLQGNDKAARTAARSRIKPPANPARADPSAATSAGPSLNRPQLPAEALLLDFPPQLGGTGKGSGGVADGKAAEGALWQASLQR